MTHIVYAYMNRNSVSDVKKIAKRYDSFRDIFEMYGDNISIGVDFEFSTARAAKSFRNILRNRRKGFKIITLNILPTFKE